MIDLLSISNENHKQTNFKAISKMELADLRNPQNLNLEDIPIDAIQPIKNNENNDTQIESDNPLDQEQSNDQKSSAFQASINLIKSYVGGGLLALPYIFYQTGYVLSTITLIITGGLVYYSTMLLFELVQDTSNKIENVAEVFNRTMGRRSSLFYLFFLATYQFGICVSYAIFFTEFFQIAFNTESDPSSRILYACLSLVVIFPLSMINNFHFFVKFSNIGNILILITLIAILQLDFLNIDPEKLSSNEHNLGTFSTLPSFIGVSIFAFECIGNIFPIKNSMKEPEQFARIFKIVSIIVCVVYIMFSVINCISLGDRINQIILMDLQKIQSFFYIFQTFYAVALILSYPLQFFPLVIIIEDINIINRVIKTNDGYNNKRYLVRFFLTLIIFALAFLVPKFASFLNLIGAFAGINLQFVFPIIAYHNTFKLVAPKWKIYLNIFVLILGIICSGFGVYDSIKELSK